MGANSIGAIPATVRQYLLMLLVLVIEKAFRWTRDVLEARQLVKDFVKDERQEAHPNPSFTSTHRPPKKTATSIEE